MLRRSCCQMWRLNTVTAMGSNLVYGVRAVEALQIVCWHQTHVIWAAQKRTNCTLAQMEGRLACSHPLCLACTVTRTSIRRRLGQLEVNK